MPVKILMPALSPTMTEGNLIKWLKKEGDTIKAGDLIAEIETDKATMEVEAVDEGTLGKIVVPEGTESVQVNQIIGLILEEGEDKAALKDVQIEAPVIAEQKKVEAPKTANDTAEVMIEPVTTVAATATSASRSTSSAGRIIASPLAKRIAEQTGVNLTTVQGTGPHGRIIKADVEKAMSAGPIFTSVFSSTRQPGEMPSFQTIKLNNMRKVIAKRLSESKQHVPHFYLTVDCEVSKLLDMRQDINDSLGDKIVSVNDLIIRACAIALRKVPEANAAWADDHIRQYEAVDISIAVAIPGGLITPVLRDADRKSVVQIAREGKELFKRAREGKLLPEEFQGGTFSLSNLGMYGIQHFGAIINPPQGCILAVGAAEEKPIIRDGGIDIGNVMCCTLSVDHRAVDGAVGAEFLKVFKEIISKPVMLMM